MSEALSCKRVCRKATQNGTQFETPLAAEAELGPVVSALRQSTLECLDAQQKLRKRPLPPADRILNETARNHAMRG